MICIYALRGVLTQTIKLTYYADQNQSHTKKKSNILRL